MTKQNLVKKQLKVNLRLKLLFFFSIFSVFIGEHVFNSYLFSNNISFSLIENSTNPSVVFAQTVRPDEGAQLIYEALPELPLANEYISENTGEIAEKNTFVSRLIRYHQFVKSRPSIYRLDWKLTLADYLNKNERIQKPRYPGNSTLTQNPLEDDRKIIQSLTREQRNELVNTLVSLYNPNFEQTTDNSSDSPTSNSSEQEEDNSRPTVELAVPSGAADLLLP